MFFFTKHQKVFCLPLMPTVILLLEKQKKVFCLPLMPRRAFTFAITKIQKSIGLPLMPRRAFTFASRGKSKQKRSGTRRQNLSAQASAQPQLSRSKQPQTRRCSNSGAVLPRCARPLGIRRRLCERLAVKVPTPVLHRCAENKMYYSTGRML